MGISFISKLGLRRFENGYLSAKAVLLLGILCSAPASFQPQTHTELRDAVYTWRIDRRNAQRSYGEIGLWNVGHVTDMANLFRGFDEFNDQISNWNTGRVTTMKDMFSRAYTFNQNLGNWSTERVTTMDSMFLRAYAFNQPVGDWNTGSVNNMQQMFINANTFSQPLGDWNTGSVTSMEYMFGDYHCIEDAAFNELVGDWNTGSVTSMSFMFYCASAFDQSVGDWDISRVTDMESMFFRALAFNRLVGDWDTGSVNNVDSMFYYAVSFNQPVGGWNTGSISNMYKTFASALFFNQAIGDWNTGSVTNMAGMFEGAAAFNQAVGEWNIGSVTSITDLFKAAIALCQPSSSLPGPDFSQMSLYRTALICISCDKYFQNCAHCTAGGCLQCANASYNMQTGYVKFISLRRYVELPAHCDEIDEGCCIDYCPVFFFGTGSGDVGNSCEPCESSCLSCYNASACIECADGKYLHNSKCYYLCPSGTLANGSQEVGRRCLACGDHCSSCLNYATCYLCMDGRYLHNTSCLDICPPQTYPAGFALTGRTCENCGEYCTSCYDSFSCTKCASVFYVFKGTCVATCPNGMFASENTSSCGACSDQCSSCVDSGSCLECTNFKYLYNRYCVNACPSGTAQVGLGSTGRFCAPCEPDCAACSDEASCTMCSTNKYLHNSDCVAECPQGSTATVESDLGLICAACGEPFCLQCPSQDICETCHARYVHNGACVISCPVRTFANSSRLVCQDCGLHCSSCASASECLVCSGSMYLFENSCLESCPLGTSEVGVGSAGRSCQQCIAMDCGICQDVFTCTACMDSKYLYQGRCFPSCPSKTVELGSGFYACADCENANCLICGSPTVCRTCANSTYLHRDDCLKECPSGTFESGEEDFGRTCQSCQADCSLCSTPSSCLGCMNGKYLHDGNCLESCPSASVATGSGMVGLTCSDPEVCSFLFTASLETGGCDPNWPLLSGISFCISLLLLALLVWFLQHRSRKELAVAIEMNNESSINSALERARKFRVSHSDQTVKAATRQLKVLRGKYTDYEALLQILHRGAEFGDMKLLRGSWLMDSRNISRLKRQQELPKEAFWSPNELRSQLTVVSIVAISYCWLHPVNPDPHSKHLRELQRAVKLRLELKGPGRIQDLAIFLDFTSIPQHGEQGDENDPVLGDLRSSIEEAAFFNALQHVNIPYASQLTETWMMKWVPDDEPRKYMLRGWPFFEQAVSGLIKPTTMLIEINAEVLDAQSWIDTHERGKTGRKPPLIPSKFKQELASKTFTNGISDRKFVEDKYEETFEDVVGTATALWFAGVGWTDTDAEAIIGIYPFAINLERLLLSDNEFSKVGAEVLVRACGICPSLQNLDLSQNRICEDDLSDLQQIWDSLGKEFKGLRIDVWKRSSTRSETVGYEKLASNAAERLLSEARAAAIIGNAEVVDVGIEGIIANDHLVDL